MKRRCTPLIFLIGSIVYALFGCNITSPSATPQSPTLPPAPSQPANANLENRGGEVLPAQDLPAIAYGEIKEGHLDTALATESWIFEAQAGERVNLVVNGQFDSYLELYAPDGELITSNDDSNNSLNAALFDIQIRRSGPHTVVVRGYDQTTGSYALALTGGHPTVSGGILNNGDIRPAILSNEGTKWHYQGQKDTYLTVISTGDEGIDPYLSLYGPDGTLLISDDDSGSNLNAEIFEFQLPADGLYTLQARTISATGLVTLTLNSSPKSTGGGILTSGKTQNGTLAPGRTQRWEFKGEAGDVIMINATSTEFDTFLELRDAQGAILAENDDYGDSTDSTIAFVLPTKATYAVVIRGLSDSEEGQYELSLDQLKIPPGGGPLEVDTPTEAVLLPGYVDNWYFTASEASFVTIKVEADLLDTYLELYDSEGALPAEDDDSGGELNAALLDVPVATDGEYQVVVRSSQPNSNQGGVYEITLTVTEDASLTGRLVSDEPQSITLEQGEQHTWTFAANTGDFVTVKMESDTLDTHLALYNSEGTLLTLNDDYIGVQAAIVNFDIPADDQYRVVARTYSANETGDYTITLQITDRAVPFQSSR